MGGHGANRETGRKPGERASAGGGEPGPGQAVRRIRQVLNATEHRFETSAKPISQLFSRPPNTGKSRWRGWKWPAMKGTENEDRGRRPAFAVRAPAGSLADSPKVNRGMIEAMEHSLDNKLSGLWPQDPAEVLGVSQGAYVQGYGAVFLSEVNLAPAAGISPFHPTVNADEVRRTHEKKVQRMAAIRAAMRAMLVDSARSLDSVPADEQVAWRSFVVLLEVGESRRPARADRDARPAQGTSAIGRRRPSSDRIRRVLIRCAWARF